MPRTVDLEAQLIVAPKLAAKATRAVHAQAALRAAVMAGGLPRPSCGADKGRKPSCARTAGHRGGEER